MNRWNASALLVAATAGLSSCSGSGNRNAGNSPIHGAPNTGSAAPTRPVVPPLRLRDSLPPPPALDAASSCDSSIGDELSRYRVSGRAWHLGPVCSGTYGSEWAALFVTGTPTEASDIWITLHTASGDELHRVRRAPVGVRYTAATFRAGVGYVTGRSLAVDEQPAGADVLVTFVLPTLDGRDPEALDLDVRDLGLLGATDSADLSRRVAAQGVRAGIVATEELVASLRTLREGAAAGLVAAAGTRRIPVLRAWQTGVYQKVGELTSSLAVDDGITVAANDAVQAIGETVECSTGDRCFARPAPSPSTVTDASVQAQVLFRPATAGTALEPIAFVVPGHRPDELAVPNDDRLNNQTSDAPDDRTVATQFGIDGTVEGRVAGISRGSARIVAWGYERGGHHAGAVYVVLPDRAPRRFEDPTFDGLATGTREMAFRDVEGNFEPELVSIASVEGGREAVGVSTLLWPPAVIDRTTYARMDAMRLTMNSASLADADRAFQGYEAPGADRDENTICPQLEGLSNQSARHLAEDTPGVLVQIEYATPGQPLRGAMRRVSVGEMRRAHDGNHILGPFAGATCANMSCDWFQGFCRRPATGPEIGYLFFTGRRSAPLWGLARLVHQRPTRDSPGPSR